MKTLRKVGEILRCFSATQPEHNVSSLARRIGNSVSGTHDLVAGLSQIGLLQKVDRGLVSQAGQVVKVWHLGGGFFAEVVSAKQKASV